MNKIYSLMLSKNKEDVEIAKILLEKDPDTHKKLLKIAKYTGCRCGLSNSDKEFWEDFNNDDRENLYFNIHKLGIINNSAITFGKTWYNSTGREFTKRGKYYKSAVKALRELRQ